MLSHLRANLWLLVLTVGICCVLYPAAVWVVGQVCFHDQAEGGLIYQKVDGKDVAIGSNLIAQPFNSSWFFQARPSATSPSAYNAAASGGSNYGASNPKLRGRVAQQLGPIVRYSDAYKKAHPNADGGEPNPQDDIRQWFHAQKGGVLSDTKESDVPSVCFDAWLTEQVQAKKLDPLTDFVQVPADMVTTSGSGLDPDISLANALYQKETVVPAYADKLATDLVGRDENKNLTDDAKKKLHDDLTAKLAPQIGAIVERLLDELASRPMFGLTGDKPLVNVLQLNLRLQAEAAKIKVQ